MTQPWFEPNMAWIPGTVFGGLGGLLGSLIGVLAPMGRAKKLLVGAYWLLLSTGALMAILAVVGWMQGQPYGVWYGLGLPGVLALAVFGPLGPVLYLRYRQAEERKMAAHDLR